MAIQAAVSTFREAGDDAAMVASLAFDERRAYFNLLRHYYKNTVFDSVTTWAEYRKAYTLYKNIRPIYNPTRRLVNFYVAQVYPGVLSEDGSQLPDGVQLAIPLTKDTPEELRAATAQFWQWSLWQSKQRLMVRYGAMTGSSLVEILDDTERGKVSAVVRWPGLVSEIELDDVGNVKYYALEYDAEGDDGKTYLYRAEKDKDSFRYYADDKKTEEIENPFGFVPAVWCKHVDEGGDFGSPAIAGSIGKIDELNGLASHNSDNVDTLIDSPGMLASEASVGYLGQKKKEITAEDEYANVAATRVKNAVLKILRVKGSAQWIPMIGNLSPERVIPVMAQILTELEHDFPELSMYQRLREMSNLTGPAAARLMGDVSGRVQEVASNYDTQSIKLFQIAAAVGGFRYREGREGWRERTPQRAKFADFDLTSYARGELDMSIAPRPLVPLTEAEAVEMQGRKLDNARKAGDVGFSDGRVLELAGVPEDERQAELTARAQKQEERSLTGIAARIAAGAQSTETVQ